MSERPLVVGIELGGTKCIASLGRGRDIVDQARLATATPRETIPQLIAQLSAWRMTAPFAAIGIASFGPLASDNAAGGLMGIAATPKPGWSDTPLVAPFAEHFGVPVTLDTDVAGAALAEWRWGAFAGARSLVYLTIGTGIGGALIVDGRAVEGIGHAEMGHVRVRRRPGDDFPGICPFHRDCLEGLAAGPAIKVRAGSPAAGLDIDHPVWVAVADEVAELITMLTLAVRPNHILLGGGVGTSSAFPLDLLRRAALAHLGGYLAGFDQQGVERMITQASLVGLAGPLGSIAIAERALTAADEVRSSARRSPA